MAQSFGTQMMMPPAIPQVMSMWRKYNSMRSICDDILGVSETSYYSILTLGLSIRYICGVSFQGRCRLPGHKTHARAHQGLHEPHCA